jgi:hypothetical protein
MGGSLEGGDFIERVGLRLLTAAEEGTEEAWLHCGLSFDGIGILEGEQFVLDLMLLGLALGAFFTPVAPAVIEVLAVDPAILYAFSDDGETDCCGEVDACRGEYAGDEPGALDVDIGDEEAGHETTDYSLDGEEMEPAPVPGNEAEGCGEKFQGEEGADPAEEGRTSGAGVHPGPAEAADPDGQEEGRDAEGLEEQVAEISAEEADPVARGVGAGDACGGVE